MLWTAEFKLLQFLSLTSRSPLFRNRSLCQCSPGWPFLLQGERVARAETETWGIISSAAHKTNLFILSGSAHLPAHLRLTSPPTLCTLHHTTTFYFLPMFPTSPQQFATLPRSIPCPHQCTLLSTACPPSTASVGSHHGCSCTAWVLFGHLAQQAACPGHCLSAAGASSRTDNVSALPILPWVSALVGLHSSHPPTWDWNQPKGSHRGALITSISLGNRAKNNSGNSINSAVQNCNELFLWYFDL